MISIPQTGQDKKILYGRWTKSEQERFIKAFQRFGRNWVDVQKHVKTRNLTQVRSHAQKVFMNKGKNGVDEDFDTQNSEQISYQDCSQKEQIKKLHKPKKKQQDFSRQPSFESTVEWQLSENDKKQIKNAIKIPAIKISLPKKQDFQEYFKLFSSKSHFMMSLMENLDYFQEGGNFVELSTKMKVKV